MSSFQVVNVVSRFPFFFFLMIRRPPRSTHCISSAASDVYKRQGINAEYMGCQPFRKAISPSAPILAVHPGFENTRQQIPLSLAALHESQSRSNAPAAALIGGCAMPGIQSFHVEHREPVKRAGKVGPAPAGEIVAAKVTVRKHGIPADEHPVLLRPKADAPPGMARRMDNNEVADGVAFLELDVGKDTRRSGAKVHGEAFHILEKPESIFHVDGDLCLAHVRDLLHPGDMVVMAMREDNGVDLLLVGLNCHGCDPGIHQHIPEDIRIGIDRFPANPPDLHAQQQGAVTDVCYGFAYPQVRPRDPAGTRSGCTGGTDGAGTACPGNSPGKDRCPRQPGPEAPALCHRERVHGQDQRECRDIGQQVRSRA
eukprot:TRINITY_DN1790_c0_g1_i1.p4 TRINITY_DN1790_c0_g1~~TRINITY_DN1790_c0_g1_i1.p4  ORF type:complete len:369 (+),score=11.61 TRINITY_DN1790_c0_g1_i1:79-1185(+)